jgi:hypothetical protein
MKLVSASIQNLDVHGASEAPIDNLSFGPAVNIIND